MGTSAKVFTDLIVWQKAHKFVLKVYKVTKTFPQSELYNLTSQFRKAAISIAANIAEGFKKKGLADKIRFYNIAQGSLEECRYYNILSGDLNFVNDLSLKKDIEEISKMLDSYIKSVNKTRSDS